MMPEDSISDDHVSCSVGTRLSAMVPEPIDPVPWYWKRTLPVKRSVWLPSIGTDKRKGVLGLSSRKRVCISMFLSSIQPLDAFVSILAVKYAVPNGRTT